MRSSSTAGGHQLCPHKNPNNFIFNKLTCDVSISGKSLDDVRKVFFVKKLHTRLRVGVAHFQMETFVYICSQLLSQDS